MDSFYIVRWPRHSNQMFFATLSWLTVYSNTCFKNWTPFYPFLSKLKMYPEWIRSMPACTVNAFGECGRCNRIAGSITDDCGVPANPWLASERPTMPTFPLLSSSPICTAKYVSAKTNTLLSATISPGSLNLLDRVRIYRKPNHYRIYIVVYDVGFLKGR